MEVQRLEGQLHFIARRAPCDVLLCFGITYTVIIPLSPSLLRRVSCSRLELSVTRMTFVYSCPSSLTLCTHLPVSFLSITSMPITLDCRTHMSMLLGISTPSSQHLSAASSRNEQRMGRADD